MARSGDTRISSIPPPAERLARRGRGSFLAALFAVLLLVGQPSAGLAQDGAAVPELPLPEAPAAQPSGPEVARLREALDERREPRGRTGEWA
jgi:hypothetical protein